MSKIGVIFDLDGVLVTTDKYHYLAWKKMADKEGIYFDEKINHQLRGVSRMDSLEIILKGANKKYSFEEKQELANFKNNYYVELLEKLTSDNLLNNVEVLLNKLKKMEIKVAIGSSSKNAKKILEQVGIIDLFPVIVDGTDIINSKPDPEVFIKAAEAMGLEFKNCYVVEDAEAGIIAAKTAGMVPIAINDAKGSINAQYHIDDLIEILDILKDSI